MTHTETDWSSEWLPLLSLKMVRASFNIPSDGQGSYPDEISISIHDWQMVLRSCRQDKTDHRSTCPNKIWIQWFVLVWLYHCSWWTDAINLPISMLKLSCWIYIFTLFYNNDVQIKICYDGPRWCYDATRMLTDKLPCTATIPVNFGDHDWLTCLIKTQT